MRATFTLKPAYSIGRAVFKELVLGRAMVGIGVGLASMVLPVYSAELSPARYRGQIVTLLVVMITFGQLVAYVLGALLAQVTNVRRNQPIRAP